MEIAIAGVIALVAGIIAGKFIFKKDVEQTIKAAEEKADSMIKEAKIKQENIKKEKLIKIINKEAHSRMPVVRGDLDNCLGMVHIKDLFKKINLKSFCITNPSECRMSAMSTCLVIDMKSL